MEINQEQTTWNRKETIKLSNGPLDKSTKWDMAITWITIMINYIRLVVSIGHATVVRIYVMLWVFAPINDIKSSTATGRNAILHIYIRRSFISYLSITNTYTVAVAVTVAKMVILCVCTCIGCMYTRMYIYSEFYNRGERTVFAKFSSNDFAGKLSLLSKSFMKSLRQLRNAWK